MQKALGIAGRKLVCAFAVTVPLLVGCASRHFSNTSPGTLHGSVVVEWYKPNLFVFHPSAAKPFFFLRSNGTRIQPAEMYTDGGSIPREFWAFRNYSPWGYGPAFVIHDWLFHQQNCKLPGYETYTVKDAAQVMSEVMKTLMETPGFDYGSEASVYLMYKAVQTPPAVSAWEHGHCVQPPADLGDVVPAARFVLDFP